MAQILTTNSNNTFSDPTAKIVTNSVSTVMQLRPGGPNQVYVVWLPTGSVLPSPLPPGHLIEAGKFQYINDGIAYDIYVRNDTGAGANFSIVTTYR